MYVGCDGVSFDATESSEYQPKGSYGMFAGRDITVALAKNSFDKNGLLLLLEISHTVKGRRRLLGLERIFR